LKTLEEPPPHIIFVFATTEPHKVPATILSRCQRYDFKRIPLREIIENLKRIIEEEKVQISQRGLFFIAQESEGSMRDAQSLLDQVISYGAKAIKDEDIAEVLGLIDRKILFDTIEAIANREGGRCMEIVEHIYHFGYDLQHFCRELLQYIRNLLLMKVSEHPEGLMELPEDELGILKKQAEKFQFERLNHLFSLLLKGEEEIAQSGFPRTMLEVTLIRMASLQPILPIDEILKKLEALEKAPPSKEQTERMESPPLLKTIRSKKLQKESELEELQAVQRDTRKGRALEKEELSPEFTEEMESTSLEESMVPENPPMEEEGPAKLRMKDESQEPTRLGGESQETREEKWREFVVFIRAKNPILGSFLALGNLVYLSDAKIEIGFEKDSFHYDRILEKGNRSQLESICQEYFKRKVKVIISALDQGMMSKGRMNSKADETVSNEKGKKLEKGMEENPLIQEAIRLFNGRIVEG